MDIIGNFFFLFFLQGSMKSLLSGNLMNKVMKIPYYLDKWNSLETEKNFFYWKEI